MTQPFQIQPFVIAPVLPGETLKTAMIQARVVTDPIVNPLVGWWMQYHLFYVKHRDLDERDSLVNMALDPAGGALTALNSASSSLYYHAGNCPNFTSMCLKRVVEEYFRGEGETWNGFLVGSLPAAQIASQNWTDSLSAAGSIVGSDLDPTDTDNTTTLQLENAMRMWEFYRANQVVSMDYEDFLRTYGVNMPKVEMHKPELIKSWSEWTYPTNTVEPTTGAPSTAVSWSVAGRSDKDFFFREPGWLFGVCIAKPKVYSSTMKGSLAHFMDNALMWFPAIMKDDPYTSMRQFADLTGPFGDVGDPLGYWVDMRDLLLYGDQFMNYDKAHPSAPPGKSSMFDLPGISPATITNKRYPTSAMTDALFKTPATLKYVKMDGVINFNILGTQMDYSPRNMGTTGAN